MHLRVLSTFFISFHIGEIWNRGKGEVILRIKTMQNMGAKTM
nr:MAG TPA: hypothetical protein [Caudoviricetes sp.]